MSLFSTLGTGTSGLKASELAIATTGHNIANANNDYYTRQRVVQSANEPFHTSPGDIGTGVNVTTIVRIHDEFVYSRLKDSSTSLSYDTFSKKTLEEVARYFPDLEGSGLGFDIENYFSSWNDLASNPDDASQKIALVQNSITLSTNLQDSRNNVRALQDSINEQLKTNVDEINRIGEQLAELNKAISRVEVVEPNRANDLRDQRDNLELTLSNILDVSVFKGDMVTENHFDANLTDQGSGYHMNIAGHSFVDGFTFHPLEITNTGNESNYYSVYSKSQDGSTIEITGKLTGGKVGAMLDLRGRNIDPALNSGFPTDGTLQSYVDDLDSFAKTFVEQTNNLYARSAQESMLSLANKGLTDSTTLVNHNESLNSGTFDVIVYDNQGKEVARKEIDINSLTTMNNNTTVKSSNAGLSYPTTFASGEFTINGTSIVSSPTFNSASDVVNAINGASVDGITATLDTLGNSFTITSSTEGTVSIGSNAGSSKLAEIGLSEGATVGNNIVDQFNSSSDDNNDNNSLNDVDDYFTAIYNYDITKDSGVLAFDAKNSLSGYTIAVEDHGTNFAGVIGLSPFLEGNSASNVDVVLKYKEDPAKMNGYGAPIDGNNDVANDMIQLQYEKFDFQRSGSSVVSESVEGFYRFITTSIATDGESANRNFETSTSLFNTINSEFQSISGVNVDEELTDLMKFQAAYGANAKVITTIDQMLDTLLGLKQ